MKITFLVPTVTGIKKILRAYPFASLLSEKNKVQIIGQKNKKSDKIRFKQTKNLRIIKLPDNKKEAVNKILTLSEDSDVVCVTKPTYITSKAGLILKKKGKRLVVDIDDDDESSIQLDNANFLTKLIKKIKIKHNFSIIKKADEVVVASTYLKKKYGGTVLPVPVENKFYTQGNKIKKNTVLYCGAIQRHKGIDNLIESMRLLNNVRLIIAGSKKAGSPIFAKEIQERAKKVSKNITFKGHVSYDNIAKLMRSAECLVLPLPNNPVHKAQTPIKLMHYMASGRPLVATDVGDIKKILKKGKCGVIVKPDDINGLAKGIQKVLKDKKFSNAIAKNARQESLKKYSFQATKKRITKIFGVK